MNAIKTQQYKNEGKSIRQKNICLIVHAGKKSVTGTATSAIPQSPRVNFSFSYKFIYLFNSVFNSFLYYEPTMLYYRSYIKKEKKKRDHIPRECCSFN